MKRLTSHIISLGLAYLFLTVGCGTNVTEYCCNLCAEHGSRIFTTSSCEDVHASHHKHEHVSNRCCETSHRDNHTQENGFNNAEQDRKCELHRLNVEEPTLSEHVELLPISFVVIVFVQEQLDLSIETSTPIDFASLKAPPNSGRDILTQFSVLTI